VEEEEMGEEKKNFAMFFCNSISNQSIDVFTLSRE
jgi:hypothetical protein